MPPASFLRRCLTGQRRVEYTLPSRRGGGMVNAADSKSAGRKALRVRVSLPVPANCRGAARMQPPFFYGRKPPAPREVQKNLYTCGMRTSFDLSKGGCSLATASRRYIRRKPQWERMRRRFRSISGDSSRHVGGPIAFVP